MKGFCEDSFEDEEHPQATSPHAKLWIKQGTELCLLDKFNFIDITFCIKHHDQS